MTFQALQPRAAGPAAGAMGVAFFWPRGFAELRTARWLDGRG